MVVFVKVHDAVRMAQKQHEEDGIVESSDGEPLLIGTTMQYFSNFCNAVKIKDGKKENSFLKPYHACGKNEYPPFVTKLRSQMRSLMEQKLILAGIPIVLKARGFNREQVVAMTSMIIDQGTAIDVHHISFLVSFDVKG